MDKGGKLKKLIAVGTTTQNNKMVNGQTMMFQLLVDNLLARGLRLKIVDFGKSIDSGFADRRVSGKFNIIKLIDNFLVILKFLYQLAANPRTPVYINTSQTSVGFIRDYLIISISKFFGRKVVAHQFGANYSAFYNAQSGTIQNKIRETIAKTDFFVVEGDYTKKQILSFLPKSRDRIVSIPNGLPEKIDFLSNPKIISQPVKVLYLSNLIESKGYWDVLEAANILQNKLGINIKIIFAGKFLEDIDDHIAKNSKEAREKFFKKIEEYQLNGNVTYFEGLYGEKKAEIFKESHFFILPSYYRNEGQPVSVLEAIAYGCVPIVTEYRLIPSMVNQDNGFFVNPKSPSEIAGHIATAVNNPSMYTIKSQNAQNFYIENFTADKYVSEILKLF